MARVLMVDDDYVSREVICEMVESIGHSARAATSSQQAEDILVDWKPDAVILDIYMPQELGFFLCERLRAAYPNLAILIVSAFMQHFTEAEVLSFGPDEVLAKPVRVQHLRRVLQDTIRKRNHPCTSMVCMPEKLRGLPANTVIDKTCTICGAHWETMQDLHNDPQILILGTSPFLNGDDLLLFVNCNRESCGTSLSVRVNAAEPLVE